MSEPLDLFTAAAKRDRALRVVEENAPGWVDRAVDVIRDVAARQPTVTGDDVWASGIGTPREPRALGAAFIRARMAGVIERTGMTRPSQRPENNARHVRVWRSKLYRPSGYELHGRERKAGAYARALLRLDEHLSSDTPLSERAEALDPSGWSALARIIGKNEPSEATRLRVIEIIRDQERRGGAA